MSQKTGLSVSEPHEVLKELWIQGLHDGAVNFRRDSTGLQEGRCSVLDVHTLMLDVNDVVGKCFPKHVGHGFVRVIPLDTAPDIDENEVPFLQFSMVASEQRDGRAHSVIAAGTVKVRRIDGTFAEADVSQNNLRFKHAETGHTVVSFLNHDGVERCSEFRLAHPFFEHFGNALFENLAVNLPGLFHQGQFIGAFDRPDRGHLHINGSGVFKGKVFLKTLVESQGDDFCLQVDHLRKGASHPFSGLPETAHRFDVGKVRLIHGPFVAASHPVNRFIATGNQ